MNLLFRPIAKIRLIWAYFETEPDTGFFWDAKRAIGGWIGPGWDEVCKGDAREEPGRAGGVFGAGVTADPGMYPGSWFIGCIGLLIGGTWQYFRSH